MKRIVFVVFFGFFLLRLIIKPSADDIKQAAAQITAEHSEPVIFYSAEWCGYCTSTRQFLNQNKISFVEYDIEKSKKGDTQYYDLGGGGIPLLIVKGEVIRGYDPKRIQSLLKR